MIFMKYYFKIHSQFSARGSEQTKQKNDRVRIQLEFVVYDTRHFFVL
jgi:hypothetical protein